MKIKFDKEITENKPEIFNYIESRNILSFIYFIIDTNARKSVKIQEWLKEFARNPSEEIKSVCDKEIPNNSNPDYIMTDILRWTVKNILYKSDLDVWKMSDKWQTPQETITKFSGDCEDGAILMYVMAIYKGVPANRLLLLCGDVRGGGHCWLAYRSTEYPLNWCFMDWCYWPTLSTPNSRPKYFIDGQNIYDDVDKNYLKIWFGFNHLNSYMSIKNTYGGN